MNTRPYTTFPESARLKSAVWASAVFATARTGTVGLVGDQFAAR